MTRLGLAACFVAVVAACGGRLAAMDDEGLPPIDGEDASVEASRAHDASLPDTGDDASPDADADTDARPDATTCPRFATSVVDHRFGTGQNHNQTTGFPAALFGPPFADNPDSVVSLGNGGYVVLAFGNAAIVDGPGVDFIVFENALSKFKELATVAVSEDGVTWTSFPCTWQRGDSAYGSCAGVNPVLSTPLNGVDPTDPAVSGGDGFDLHDIGVTRARYVRITDRADLDGNDGVFDLDAVAIVHTACP